MNIKKTLSLVPALMLLGTTAMAAPAYDVNTCPLPCYGKEITLKDGSKACPFHIPQEAEAEIFIVKLSEDGKNMLNAMRTSETRRGAFSVRSVSAISRAEAERFGSVVLNTRTAFVRNNEAAQPFGFRNFFGDEIPLYVGNDESRVPIGYYNLGTTLTVNVVEAACNMVGVNVNALIVTTDSFLPDDGSLLPRLSVLSAEQTQKIPMGTGFVVGGFENVGNSDTEDEFVMFVNMRQPNTDATAVESGKEKKDKKK